MGYGTRARVEVIHQFVALHVCQVEGGAIQPFRLIDIGLEERHWSDTELEVVETWAWRLHRLDEERVALQAFERQVVDDVVQLGIDDEQQADNLWEGGFEHRHELVAYHGTLLVDDKDDHELALRIAADDEVAHQSFVGTDVVVGYLSF